MMSASSKILRMLYLSCTALKSTEFLASTARLFGRPFGAQL